MGVKKRVPKALGLHFVIFLGLDNYGTILTIFRIEMAFHKSTIYVKLYTDIFISAYFVYREVKESNGFQSCIL